MVSKAADISSAINVLWLMVSKAADISSAINVLWLIVSKAADISRAIMRVVRDVAMCSNIHVLEYVVYYFCKCGLGGVSWSKADWNLFTSDCSSICGFNLLTSHFSQFIFIYTLLIFWLSNIWLWWKNQGERMIFLTRESGLYTMFTNKNNFILLFNKRFLYFYVLICLELLSD